MIGLMCAGGLPDTKIILPNSGLDTGARVSGIPCWATWKLAPDRKLYRGVIHSNDYVNYFTIYDGGIPWLDGSGTPGNYDARMTAIEGTLEGSAAGAWLNLASEREWKMADYTADGVGFIGTATLEIRNASTQRIVKVATITFDVWRM